MVELQESIIKSDCIIWHSFDNDIKILEAEFLRHDIKYLIPTVNYIDIIDERKFNTEKIKSFPYFFKLDDLYLKLFNYSVAHDDTTLGTVRIIYKCFWELIKQGIIIFPKEDNNSYNIDDLISIKNKNLLEKIKKSISVEYSYTGFWNTKFNKDKVIIYCDTSYFIESFFSKELLEIDLKLKGFKKIEIINFKKNAITATEKQEQKDIKSLIFTIVNIYEKSRLYNEFMILEYPENEFKGHKYKELDEEIGKTILSNTYYDNMLFYSWDIFLLNSQDNNFISDIRQYLQILNPKIKIHKENFINFRNIIKATSSSHYNLCNKLDNIYLKGMYILDNTIEEHLRKVLKLFDIKDVWIGYDSKDKFPNNGFFIGKTFNLINKQQ